MAAGSKRRVHQPANGKREGTRHSLSAVAFLGSAKRTANASVQKLPGRAYREVEEFGPGYPTRPSQCARVRAIRKGDGEPGKGRRQRNRAARRGLLKSTSGRRNLSQ